MTLSEIKALIEENKALKARIVELEENRKIGLSGKEIEEKYGISSRTRFRWYTTGKLKKVKKIGRNSYYKDPCLK